MQAELKYTNSQVANVNAVIDQMNKDGIDNKYAQAGILAVIAKEVRFLLIRENMNYSAERLLQVFPSYFKTLEQAKQYEHQPEKIANYVYGNRGGNDMPGDGWKFRGGPYNGLTFKSGYRKYSKIIGVDLESNPDKLLQPDIAAKYTIAYFLDNYKRHNVNYNNFSNLNDGVDQALLATDGYGKPVTKILGYDSAHRIAPLMLTYIESSKKN